jgi:hypothetical protein
LSFSPPEMVRRLLPRLTGNRAGPADAWAELSTRLVIFKPKLFPMNNTYTLRCCALILLAAGYGWAGGHFIAPDVPLWAYAFQFFILLLLLIFSVGFLTAMAGPAASPVRLRRYAGAITVFAVLTLIINIANIIRGALVQGPVGSHNTFADLVPIGMILAGDIIWLLTLLRPSPGRSVRQ